MHNGRIIIVYILRVQISIWLSKTVNVTLFKNQRTCGVKNSWRQHNFSRSIITQFVHFGSISLWSWVGCQRAHDRSEVQLHKSISGGNVYLWWRPLALCSQVINSCLPLGGHWEQVFQSSLERWWNNSMHVIKINSCGRHMLFTLTQISSHQDDETP